MLLILAAIQFTHIVDFMVMMPLGPQLTRIFALSDAQFGLLISAYTLAGGVSGLAAMTYIDRFERRRLMLTLYAGLALATLACGLAPSYPTLMAARVAAGVFGGVLGALVQTIVADAVPFERRGAAMGLVMSSFSLATVAGVPISLWLANQFGWHMPFIAIAGASALIGVAALKWVPRMTGHLQPAGSPRAGGAAQLGEVLGEPNHWRAFGLSVLLVMSSFTIIPYITIFTTTNLGLSATQVPFIYLAGGLATLFTARLWGRLADRHGKVPVFRALVLAALVPIVVLPRLETPTLPVILVVTTLFFVMVSGRMVPGMALITAAVEPRRRGAFMSLNNALQSGAMGLASFIGGLLISRDAQGLVQGYERSGWIGLVCSLVALWLVGRLRVVQAAPAPSVVPARG